MYNYNSHNLMVTAPAIAPPGAGQVYAAYLRGIKNTILSLKGNPIDVLERNNIDPHAIDDEYYLLDCLDAVNLLEYCCQTLNDPLFGLRLASLQEPDVWGCIVALARSAPTVLKGLQSFIEYQPVSNSPEGMIEIVTSRNIVEMRFSSRHGAVEGQQIYFQYLLPCGPAAQPGTA